MLRLADHSHLRNPLFTTKQCNCLEPVISREGKVIGTLFCPKDVWAELRMAVPTGMADFTITFDNATGGFHTSPINHQATETSGGFYCAAHFMRMLAVERTIKGLEVVS